MLMARSVFECYNYVVIQSASHWISPSNRLWKVVFFCLDGKKRNVVPIHKKDDKQCLRNYRPISLLPVCGKIFEKLIFYEMFKFFIENELISPNQSGFKPGDSCINQLFAITHEINKSFDDGFEVGGVFLDILKAFDKVWHETLIFKLKQNGISGNLLNLL